jgi:adenylate cyclase
MSQVLVGHRALVNKFMGDGIFAFFNAPIWPCANHGEQACACALASQTALTRLNRETKAAVGEEGLVMRIGLATGEAFVGDYGSDTKLDYTCIGDTANLASRLEKACKVLGTSILVNEGTRRQAGDRFAFRPLGRLALPGKQAPVQVHELVGLRETVDARVHAYITAFEQVILAYQACQWDSCLDRAKHCQTMRGDDLALDMYREAATTYRSTAPPQDWDGALQLTDREP